MRAALDRLFHAAGVLAALFMVGTLAMVIVGVAARLLGFNVPGTDSYAGYCMAAAGFLALAHTLKRGEHIRVTLMERVRQAVRRNLRSPSLGPDKLCREAATSRSQLYRLLENEGGVKSYIQRRRLV